MFERKMKNSGIDWIGTIPNHWNIGRAKNYFINHKDIVKGDVDKYERLALTLNGVIKRSKEALDGLQPEKFDGYQILNKNELVFKLIDLENVNTSRVGLSPYTGIVSPAYICLKKRNNRINEKFAEFFFLSMWQREVFNHLGDDGVRSNLNASDLLNIPFPLLDYQEQTKIANFLDSKISLIDNAISKTKESIEEYKKLKQSIITDVITKGLNTNTEMKDSGIKWIGDIPKDWSIKKFKHLGKCRNGLTYSPDEQCGEEGTLVLRSSNIQNGKLDFNDCVYVDKNVPEELMVKPGDILICSRNGSAKLIGKNVIIPEGLVSSFGAFMMIYRCEEPRYLQYIISSHIFNYYLGTFLTVSVNQLTGSAFENIQFPYTSNKEEQEKIVKYLDEKCFKYEELISKKEKLIEELVDYKKSLIYEYVTGKKEA